jgi:GT2 family glycosyltransferase
MSRGDVALSVIIPTHDRRELLERKLRALEREPSDFEVVVIVDACTDDTLDFIGRYAPPYPLQWAPSTARHVAHARNQGARMARGRILLFSDDDVVGRPGWVAANLAAHVTPRVVGISRLVLPPHLTHGVTGGPPARWYQANGASMGVQASFFHEVGGYDPSFSTYGGEDNDLGYRLLRAGARFVWLRDAVAEHWDEAFAELAEEKARSAGAAHVRVWRKYRDDRIAWALGVHPALLAVKRLVWNRLIGTVVTNPAYRYQRAYAEGARQALRTHGVNA